MSLNLASAILTLIKKIFYWNTLDTVSTLLLKPFGVFYNGDYIFHSI